MPSVACGVVWPRVLAEVLPAGGAAEAAWALLALLLGGGPGAWLYTRVTREDALRSPPRRALHGFILANPGAHVAEIARALGLSRVALQHHLRVLEAHGLVVGRPRGRVLACFGAGRSPDEAEVAARVALKDPTRRRVLGAAAAAREAGATQGDLVRVTGISQRLVAYHLARLEAVGLVEGDRGRPQRFRAVERPGIAPQLKKNWQFPPPP